MHDTENFPSPYFWPTVCKYTNKQECIVLCAIKNEDANGATALYTAISKGIEILDKETDEYTKTIIAMTDGYANEYKSINDLRRVYNNSKQNVPVYGITFGQATEYQLNEIANLTNAKVFNGKDGLLRAFKEIRSYN